MEQSSVRGGREKEMINPAPAYAHPAPGRGGEFGGHTGGVWEVLERHLPCFQPFIYRHFGRLTGGGEVFSVFSKKRRHL